MTYLRLSELARDANLDFDQRTFQVAEVRESSLRRLEISMRLAGEYSDIRNFIHQLERSPEFVVVTGVELAQGQQQDAPLDLAIQLATFYRLPAGQGPDDGR
jgi:Tfp pilus assembly protein PilO